MIKRKEKKTIFSISSHEQTFPKRKRTYVKTYWKTTHLEHHVKFGWNLNHLILVFVIHYIKVHFLFFINSRIHGCVLFLINEVDYYVDSAMFFDNLKPVPINATRNDKTTNIFPKPKCIILIWQVLLFTQFRTK